VCDHLRVVPLFEQTSLPFSLGRLADEEDPYYWNDLVRSGVIEFVDTEEEE